jgi:tetratricopeptide (TPR) repeat protein
MPGCADGRKAEVDVFVPANFMYYNMKNFYASSKRTTDFEKLIPKIEKVILDKLNQDEFLNSDYYTYKTLIQIYDDSKDYKKAIYALEKINSAYPEDSVIIKLLNNFRTLEG